jgi:hypothetical protein
VGHEVERLEHEPDPPPPQAGALAVREATHVDAVEVVAAGRRGVGQPRTCSSVDLPDPDGPMIAVYRAVGKSSETSSRARTAVSPLPYTFDRCTARAARSVRSSMVGTDMRLPLLWVMRAQREAYGRSRVTALTPRLTPTFSGGRTRSG